MKCHVALIISVQTGMLLFLIRMITLWADKNLKNTSAGHDDIRVHLKRIVYGTFQLGDIIHEATHLYLFS